MANLLVVLLKRDISVNYYRRPVGIDIDKKSRGGRRYIVF